MSNGLGAGFAALTLLAVLLGFAAVVGLVAVAAFVLDHRTGQVPWPLRYLAVVVLVGVVGVAGFGVAAFVDEALPVAALLAVLVLVPLVAVGGRIRRAHELQRVDVLAATAMAWSLPFVAGVVATFGLATGIDAVFGLAPAESRQLGVVWIAMAVGGLVVVVGGLLLGERIARWLPAAPSS